MAAMAAILDFPSERLDFFFYLQVTPMLPTDFQVNWLFSSAEEAKDRFSRWPPSLISDRNNFSYFLSTNHPDASYQFSSQLALWFRKKSEKNSLKMAAMAAILDFPSERF